MRASPLQPHARAVGTEAGREGLRVRVLRPACVAAAWASPVLVSQDRDGRSYLSSLAPRRLGSARDAEEKENR